MLQQKKENMSEGFVEAVQRQSMLFGELYASGKIEELVRSYYVETPHVSAPDVPLLVGQQAIIEFFHTLKASGVEKVELETVHLSSEGAFGHEIGRAAMHIRGDAGLTVQDSRYVVVWRHTEAGWRVETDMFAMGGI